MAQECFDKGYPLVEKQISLEGGLDRLIFLQAAYPLFDREKEADLVEMTEALTAKFEWRKNALIKVIHLWKNKSPYTSCLPSFRPGKRS
ncbi:UPF0102 protein VV0603 [Listeria monocytogenes N53-1]|nr:UPF0102 protein VV0603 [Listeria monocytogenes N53-1]